MYRHPHILGCGSWEQGCLVCDSTRGIEEEEEELEGCQEKGRVLLQQQ